MGTVSIEVTLSVALGLIFLAAALPKLHHPKGFVLAVLEYRVLPPAIGRLYGLLVPPLELLIALMLLSGIATRSAAIMASALMASFIVGISVNVARGRELDCHCFGQTRTRKIGRGTLLRDSALLATCLATAVITRAWVGPEPWSVLRLAGLVHAGSPAALLGCLTAAASTALLLGRSVSPRRRYRRHVTGKADNAQAGMHGHVAVPRR